ncbi:isocitrate lyase/phosphoenolpyruvate mutase family protein [Quadrisphaera sp. DSM 44207]|uniref:isocitrate lyase/PEP mutase family protein n=1 Tax=Quadrisphaera sp. DSM 44207 TaxID=1881057 RepID=UPI00087FA159|nr:isocitrate lyase/phosphoenolpyruvate mutase family protein [Quadrisphaera sp. DSM 44207]SDQ40049.1 2-Methylisocitrate lyase, PEP mutase family [Quadrisphaera sp. DSM 44207]
MTLPDPDKAAELLRLHTDPEPLVLVNVWDVVSARVVADQPGCRALATAGHSIASSFGFPDGQVPLDAMIDVVGRIAAAVDLPVSADLDDGREDPGETTRRAIGAGAVGANVEDRMRPLPEAVARVEAVVRAGEAEGVPFVLNARTDAFLRAGERDREEVLADAVERGRAFLDAGAACVFVPGLLDEATVGRLVEGIGERRVSVIAVPGSPAVARLAELGVARISYGPWTQRVALTALAQTAADLLRGGALPEGTRPLD